MAVEIEGVAQHLVPGFLAGLAQASETLGAIPARLEAGRVHDVAFGKLFDAAKVRDAYHQRLPATIENIAEARQLIDHFITEFGGTAILTPEESAAADAAATPSRDAANGDGAAQVTAAQETPPTGEAASAAGRARDVPTESGAEAEGAAAAPTPAAAPPGAALTDLIPGQAEAPAAESIPDES